MVHYGEDEQAVLAPVVNDAIGEAVQIRSPDVFVDNGIALWESPDVAERTFELVAEFEIEMGATGRPRPRKALGAPA